MSNLFRPFIHNNSNKLDFIRYQTIGKHKSAYFDYTASGLAFRPIENRIHNVLETYANTHSKESSMAFITHNYYEEAMLSLKESFALTNEFEILPGGCGATAAIKKLQELLGLYIPPATRKRYSISIDKSKMPLVIVGPYEHHSNEISYREALCEIKRINLNDEGLINLEELEEILKTNSHREIIGTFCTASNVTGILTCYKEISNLLRKYKALVCFDAAASSSYMNIDCTYYDAMFVSPHKLLGGPGSCGLLIVKKSLIDLSISPTFAGGGTVTYVNQTKQNYSKDIQERETAGTPGILQLIRASLAYKLRNEIGFDFIEKQKKELLKYFKLELKKIPQCKIYGNQEIKNIGIVSFNIGELDPYLLCDYMSKNDGMQTRAGCSCAGPYGHDLLSLEDKNDLEDKPGWLRISIHYSQNKNEIDTLITSLKNSISKI